MRFSLRLLFGVIFYAAAGCALVVSRADLVAASCDVAFVALCLIAPLGAIFARHAQRAFWIGCAIVAWPFLMSFLWRVGYHTPHSAMWNLFMRLGYRRKNNPQWTAGAEAFVAIGCSVAAGLLARWFRVRSAADNR